MIVIGSILCPLSMVLASFASELWMLYCTQGIMLGIGVGLCYTGSSTLPSYWFIRNRAFATGVAASGTCLGPMIFSPIVQTLILHLGYRNALRVLGGIGIILTGTGTILIRTRESSSHDDQQQDHPHKPLHDRSETMFTWSYIFYLLHSFLAPFGYVAPIFLAPSYASFIGATPELASLCLSIVEGANGIARILFGWLGDHGWVFTMAIWEKADTVPVYMVYLVLFGLTSGVSSGLQPVIAAELVGFGRIQQGVGLSYFLSMFGHLFGTSIVGLLHLRTGAWLAPILFAGSVTLASALAVLITRIIICKRVFVRL
ncbi:MFS general substrate transporter [Lichtheimia hyalospora FSU 10163]|nr:MFS general substrate transporter [Lichtheimia hyalospora FSU 10163]